MKNYEIAQNIYIYMRGTSERRAALVKCCPPGSPMTEVLADGN